MSVDLSGLGIGELLNLYTRVLEELRNRGVLRSTNNPIADYAEWLVARALGLELSTQSNHGFDAEGADGTRYEIKARRWSRGTRPPHFGAIRDLESGHFDFLVGVLFKVDFRVERASVIPLKVVREAASYVRHTNGWRLAISDSLWNADGVRDITARLRDAQDL